MTGELLDHHSLISLPSHIRKLLEILTTTEFGTNLVSPSRQYGYKKYTRVSDALYVG